MGLKDNELFPIEIIQVTKIQGRTNTRQYSWQKPSVFHLLAHEHTFFAFDVEMAFLKDSERLL